MDAITAKIKAAGCSHYAVTDHGTEQGWLAVRDACKKNSLIPVYGVEFYCNPFINVFNAIRAKVDASPKGEHTIIIFQAVKELVFPQMSPKNFLYFMSDLPEDKDEKAKKLLIRLGHSYEHLVGVARTAQGRENLIKLHNRGWITGHYYKPQVSLDDCLELSEGIVWTSACLGGPIAKRMKYDPTGEEAKNYLKKWEGKEFYLEVQPLDLLDQRRHNINTIKLSEETGFPLILSQDNHHINEEDWMSHRALMLSQNDRNIEELEEIYSYNGKHIPFSDLRKALNVKTTWQTQEIIERDKIPLVKAAGHHYGDVKLHWRTNDDVKKQIETTNPELLPVIDKCFAVTDSLCETLKDIPWSTKHRLTHYDDARALVLKICYKKLLTMNVDRQKYLDWLKKEDTVISACGFWDYIWTLYQVTEKTQSEGIPIGYARGSAGGCLVMFLMGIIRVDPVEYGLFFERFLNPARLGLDPKTLKKVKEMSSCPDADLDFSSINRQRVIQITEEIFGKDKVIPIGTIGEAKFRTAFGDLCRVIGIAPKDTIAATKELPQDPQGELTLEEAMKNKTFSEFIAKNNYIERLLTPLFGVVRSTGQHAGGVCIADVNVADTVPVVRAGAKEGGNIVTAFGESGAERALESIGFIKFDFLATDTVDHISLCAKALYEEHLKNGGEKWTDGVLLYPEQIPHFTRNDPEVMKKIFYTGNTDGIFQFEESIGKQLSALVKPDSVEELSDISTMIRPGCLQAPCSWNLPDKQEEGNGLHFLYSARKFNQSLNPPPNLPETILEVLKPTHYCCIYQEQMMFLIERITGGFMSLGEGDIYRRAIEQAGKGKKDAIETVAKMEATMKANSPFSAEIVDEVCKIIKGGAAYSFNKAHAIAYSLFSYSQAWFKHYYPHIFVASHVSLLSAKNKLDKVHKIVNNARSLGIAIRAPHVRHSSGQAMWSKDGKTIYLPFTMMKGVKGETTNEISQCGKESETVLDFIINSQKYESIRGNHIQSLALIGAFDDMGVEHRIKTIACATYVTKRMTKKSSEEEIKKYWEETKCFFVTNEISDKRKTMAEIEVFGSFINESPLDRLIASGELTSSVIPLSTVIPEKDRRFMAYFMITSITKKVHKSGKAKGREWLKLTCWDGVNVCELSIWAHDLEDREINFRDGSKQKIEGLKPILKENCCYLATVQADGERPVSLASPVYYENNEQKIDKVLFPR